MVLLRKIKSGIYHIRQYFFEKHALPLVKGDKISKAVLKKYLPHNAVIIDCGAHDGADTVELARCFKKGSIHAFEPVEKLYKKLTHNASTCSNISTYQLALADRNGSMDFYISEGGSDASSSLLEPKEHLTDHPDTFFEAKTTVDTLTLDQWAMNIHISGVDLLWLDMQGFELNMLKASPVILETVSVIHTEVSTKETYKSVASYEAYSNFLRSKGFELVIEAIPAGWDMGNALFVKKIKAD